MRRARLAVLSLLFSGVCACEPVPTAVPPQPTSTAVTPVAPPPTATAQAGPDLSPVSEPSDLVGLARWRSPLASISNLASCAGVPSMLVEINARMAIDQLMRELIRNTSDARKLAGLVVLDAPVDAVATLDPQPRTRPPLVALSVGLSSLEGAKAAVTPEGAPLTELAPGLYPLKGGRGDAACAVAASAGATPARLVCAEREKTLLSLAPYLARTAPGLDFGGPDLHIETRVDVFRKRYGDQVQKYLASAPGSLATEYDMGDQKLYGLLLDAGKGAQEDAGKLFNDMRRFTAEVTTSKGGTCLRAVGEVDLSGKTSWIGATFSDRLDRSGPPPALYWRLPKDSQAALYERGFDPARFATVLQKGRDLLDATLAGAGIGSAAERKKITEIIDMPYGKESHFVIAHGSVSTDALTKGGLELAKGGLEKAVESTAAGVAGWTLLGVNEGPAAMKKQLKAWVDGYKLAGVQSALKKEMGSDAKMLPVAKTASAPAGLNAGSEMVEITVPNLEMPILPDAQGSGKGKSVSLKFYIVLMPDGDTTWMAIGASKDELAKRLGMVKQGASDKDQLGARAGLDSLKNGKQLWGGFMTMAAVGQKVSSGLNGLSVFGFANQSELTLAQTFNGLPNSGQTPVLISGNGAAGPSTKLNVTLEVQQGTLEDMKALIVPNYALFRRWGWLP